MRWSQTWIPTLRADPADAEAVSHRLLVRAKIIGIIRQEMDRIGGQELLLPAMHPAELWRRSGRWEAMGEELFRVRDRKGAELALGMTCEEVVTTLALELRSYRDLPQVWYQLSTKFRDEPRPRGGLVRVREFTMKDSYSFDLDASTGLDRAFDRHREAYTRAFERLGVPAIPVLASSGQMGGSASVEFACPSEAGEDLVVRCPACGYAANVEKATSALPAAQDGPGLAAPERFDTPGARTIEDLARDHQAPGRPARRWSTWSTAGRPWCCYAATTAWSSRSCSTPPAPARSARPVPTRSATPSAPPPAASARSASTTCRWWPTRPWPAGATWSPAPTSTTSTCGGWTSTAISGSGAGPTCARSGPASPARTAAGRWRCCGPSRSATSSSSAPATPRRSACRCSAPTASRSRR